MFVTKYPPFRPFPYLSNGHVQTLLPFLHKTERARTPTQRYVVHLDDGDVLTIHDNIPQKWITGDRIVVKETPAEVLERTIDYQRTKRLVPERNAC